MNNEVAVRASVDAEISGFEMKPRTLEEAMKFCELMADSDLVPDAYKDKPGNIMVAIQMGAELGMTPMRAIRCIAVINGRASMWGDEMLAMVKNSPICEYVYESDSTDTKGVCKAKRKGQPEEIRTFSLEDAKRAGLLGKAGTWQGYTKRMLQLRARGFALRDVFPDVLAGLITSEEALDIPQLDEPANEPTAAPLTLKDKLKQQVETTAPYTEAATSVHEPAVEEVMEDLAAQTIMGNPQDYISKLKICESVREASQVGNEAEADKHLTHEDLLIVRKAVKARMVELGKKA